MGASQKRPRGLTAFGHTADACLNGSRIEWREQTCFATIRVLEERAGKAHFGLLDEAIVRKNLIHITVNTVCVMHITNLARRLRRGLRQALLPIPQPSHRLDT